ncbi:major facilitator superfamily domain-containing protein [Irpex rosettiformis]|uniref:Major facilitator superfamily domain-containing protein n=1 Tax=Irpex rosettiformis TaxID=378272 RepID=A0ACB8TPH1_9APHY|nr:major facilitator superfamily domain-containing protein [Irpex rosettiformis]
MSLSSTSPAVEGIVVEPSMVAAEDRSTSRLRASPRGSINRNESADSESHGIQHATILRQEKFDEMSKARIALILFSLGLCTFLYAIEQTIVATAVSNIGTGVKATGSLTWITTSYLLTTTVFQPLTGRLSDVFGTKRMLVCEVWVFIFGNIVAGTAHNLTQLVAGRLISGVGGAGLLSLCTIVLSQLTHERQRSTYLNLINAVFIISDSLGPIIGGALAKSGNWRWIFLLNAPIGPLITAIFIYAVHIPHPLDHSSIRAAIRTLDLFGMGFLVTWLTLLIIALNLGGDAYPWNSPVIIGLFVGAGVAFVAFVLAEKYATNPVVPLGLYVKWASRNVPIMTVVRALLFFHLYTTTFYVPITGKSNVVAAALVIPFLLTAAVSSTLASLFTAQLHIVRPPFLLGLIILPIGMGLMSTLDQHSSIGKLIGYSIICGFGFGSGTITSVIIPQAGVSKDLLPTVTAVISATPNLGGVLGVGIIGTIINNQFRHKLTSLVGSAHVPVNINDAVSAARNPAIGSEVVLAYVDAFRLGFRILAGIAVFQFVLCLGLARVVLLDDKPVMQTEEFQLEEKPVQHKSKVSVGVEERAVEGRT